MNMKKISITGKTKIGSHEITNVDTGETSIVNDYDFATVEITVPTDLADNPEFYGGDRLSKLARAHEIVLLGNLVRSTLPDSKDKTQDEKNAIAQAVIDGPKDKPYPASLDARIKTPGAPRIPTKVKRALTERATALNLMQEVLDKPYDKWSKKSKDLFNTTHPLPVTE